MGQAGRPSSSSKPLGCEYSSQAVLGSASGLLLWELLVPYHLCLTKQDPGLCGGKPQQGRERPQRVLQVPLGCWCGTANRQCLS